MRLKDRVALITGGARGIGYATAEVFIREGARVVVVDVDAEAVKEAAGALGEKATGMVMDVTQRSSVEEGVKKIVEDLGSVDILVNNAGIIKDAQLSKMEEADFDAVVSVNLKGVFNTTQVVARYMVEKGKGVILNASSVVALYGNFGQTNYVATKAGVEFARHQFENNCLLFQIKIFKIKSHLRKTVCDVPKAPKTTQKHF